MKRLAVVVILSASAGCLMPISPKVWNTRDLPSSGAGTIHLTESTGFALPISTNTLEGMRVATKRMTAALAKIVELEVELIIVENLEPHAFAGSRYDKPMIGLTTGMIMLIDEDLDEYAALIGHEIAHWAWGHAKVNKWGVDIVDVLTKTGTAALSLGLVNAYFSREQEREADELGVELMMLTGYDPQAAIRVHEKLLKHADRVTTFLSTHPGGRERIENIRAVIERSKRR